MLSYGAADVLSPVELVFPFYRGRRRTPTAPFVGAESPSRWRRAAGGRRPDGGCRETGAPGRRSLAGRDDAGGLSACA